MKDDFKSDAEPEDKLPDAMKNDRNYLKIKPYFYGTEIDMVPTTENGWSAIIKLQTHADSHRSYRVIAPSQTALFELIKLVLAKEPK